MKRCKLTNRILKRYFRIAILILWTVSPGFTQQVITVRDAENNDALEGVVIMGEPNGITAITNPNGRAEIIDLQDSTRLVFRSLGYEITRMTIGEIRSSEGIVYLQPARLSLEQVVVSATRWNQVTTRLPQKVSTLKPRDIQLYNPQTAADMLALTGEVFIQKSQQGGGSPMIRGFSANRLLYAVDGVRMNTAIFRSGNLQNVISLDPFAMESTEVLFGPGSVMYGSDAIGAVMDFRTIKPQFAADEAGFITGDATVRFATANREKTVHAHALAGFDKWALVTSLTFTDYEDLIMGKYGPDDYLRTFYVERIGDEDQVITNQNPRIQLPSGFNQRNFMQKVSFRPDPSWELEYAFHHSRLGEYDRYDRLIITSNGEPASAEWKYGPQKWDMHQLAVNNKRSRGWYSEMTTRAYYQYFQESRIDRNFNDELRRTRTENVDVFGLNMDFTKRLNAKSTLNYGGEYVFNFVGSRGAGENIENGTTPPVASRYPDAHWQSASIYALAQHQWSEGLVLQGGIRYTHYILNADFSDNQPIFNLPFSESELNDGAVTGNLGINYSPTSTSTLRFNLSTGFRAPNVDDIGKVFDSEPGSVVVPNPNLRAEYAWNGELGFSNVISEKFKIDLSAYYTLLNNAMVRRNFQLNGQDSIIYDGTLSQVQAVQNAAESNVFGFQAGFELLLPWNLSVTSTMNFQEGDEELENGTVSPSRHAAPFFGTARINYRKGNLEIALYTNYSSERSFDDMPVEEIGKPHLYASDANGNPYAPGWYTLNIQGRYQLTDAIQITAGCENLTNQRYRPYSSGLAGPGLNGVFSISAKF